MNRDQKYQRFALILSIVSLCLAIASLIITLLKN